ncbi:Acyl-CoA dehydrogenase/oxidase C-terminal [Acidimicrobiia bacterium]
MDLDPNDDQRALQEMISRFAADRFPSDVTRTFGDVGGFDRSAWRELAELGTFGIALPESAGGVGLGTIESVLVHESLGAGLVPGPLLAATLSAGLVPGVLEGDVIPAIVTRPIHQVALVEHFQNSDVLLVIDDMGIERVEIAAIDGQIVEHPTDPTTPVTVIRELPRGEQIGDAHLALAWRRLGSVLASAQLVGNSEASTSLAVGYAKEREQFGRAIGSFQAIKHMLAESFTRTEVARSSVWAAGVTIDEPEVADVDRAIAGARLMAARAATENAKTGVQVHGGMGFTWEVDAHLYLKRAWILETLFGNLDEDADLIALHVAASR